MHERKIKGSAHVRVPSQLPETMNYYLFMLTGVWILEGTFHHVAYAVSNMSHNFHHEVNFVSGLLVIYESKINNL